MSTDRDVLIFVHNRLADLYGENELLDYMHALRRIIGITPKDQTSWNAEIISNSMEELMEKLAVKDRS